MSSTRCLLAGAFEGLFDDKPSIFVAHNVEFRSAEENAAAAHSPIQKLMYSREARLLGNLERRLCDKAEFVFTLADEDRAALGVDAAGKSAALPLVTPASTYMPAGKRAPAYDATLIGTWTWQPNRIGLEWFLDQVVPHLPDDFTIAIAGSIAGRPAIAAPRRQLRRARCRRHRVRVERPRRAADQPRRQRRPAEDHRDVRTWLARGRDVAFAARHWHRARKLHGCRRPGRIRPRARAVGPQRRAMSMAHVSAATSFVALDRQLALGLHALGFQAERACA